MVLEVYLDPATINCRKVLAGLDLMNVKYDEHFINYFKGEQKSEDYVKNINPNATIPSAKDGDMIITESNAILQYAADAYGPSAAYPTDLKKRADVNRWLLWEASAWFPQCYIYIVQNVVQPLLGNKPDPAALEAAHPRFHHLAKTMDGPLGKTKFLCGNEPTIADIAVAAPMHVHWAQKLPLDEHPNIKRWMGDVEKLPAWVKTQDAVTKGLGLAGQVSNLRGSGPTAAATNGSHPADRQDVKANFNYTKDVTPKLTELYFYESEKAAGIHEPGDDPHVMSVTDGWQHAKDFTLDKNGFALSDFSTAFSEWDEEQVVRDKFYPEVVDFLKRMTGASRILVFDHTIRSKANQAKKLTQETNTSQRAPVTLVHCDYTAESGPTRVQQLLPEEAGALLSRRVAFYNVWKPIHRTVEEHPLAMCDVTSSPPADFFKLHLRYRDRDGENYVMRHNDAHHWWYFPHMTPEQAILLKTYDSMTDGRARFVGHSAFIDPTSPPDAPTRESVEIRTIAFYDS